MYFRYRLECGAGHEAIPLLDATEDIYKKMNIKSQALEEEQAKLYRGRIGLAVSSRNADDLLHYVKLALHIETERHRRMGQATSVLAVAYNDIATAWACHGEWERAILQLKESREIRENLPGFHKRQAILSSLSSWPCLPAPG